MGFHRCEYCPPHPEGNRYSHLSSGDVNLTFKRSGRSWTMPDMILHYVADHGWRPPREFIDDVMNDELAAGGRAQTKGIFQIVYSGTRIGYLSGNRLYKEQGPVPEGFVEKLEQLMDRAAGYGLRLQFMEV